MRTESSTASLETVSVRLCKNNKPSFHLYAHMPTSLYDTKTNQRFLARQPTISKRDNCLYLTDTDSEYYFQTLWSDSLNKKIYTS